MSVSPDIKTQTEVLGYQNEVKKCHLMLHLKFDKVEEAKLEGSGFQRASMSVSPDTKTQTEVFTRTEHYRLPKRGKEMWSNIALKV